jgi:hypothetical protein
MNCSHCPFALLLTSLALACFAFAPQAQATCQDGCLGNENTVQGDGALIRLTSGTDNTGFGFEALFFNTTGSANTAIGDRAFRFNTTGSDNTAVGEIALKNNTEGANNSAVGSQALASNTTGGDNTATGAGALGDNTTGNDNTAIGFDALLENTIGEHNTATGVEALELNSTGTSNTATGNQALQFNATGNFNTANGDLALSNNVTGSNNIALGANAGANVTTGNNNIEIGNVGASSDSGTIRIGKSGTQTKTFIAGISGATVPTGVPVIVDTTGHLGTTTSSARFKDEIKSMDKASEAILALKPVTFRYKHELDPAGIPQFGLVAEEVEKVNPDLVARDDHGKPYTVRYEAINAMLLNEFLKEHGKVEEQQATIAELKSTVAQQKKGMEALTAAMKQQASQIEKVSAQLC